MLFVSMPAAFSQLDIPPVYAMLFFLSIFLAGIVFLVSTVILFLIGCLLESYDLIGGVLLKLIMEMLDFLYWLYVVCKRK